MERILNPVQKPNVFVWYNIGIEKIHLISDVALEYKVNVIDNIIQYCYNYINNPRTEFGKIVFANILEELLSCKNNGIMSSSLIGFILEDIHYSLLTNREFNIGTVTDICNKSVPYFYINVFNRNDRTPNVVNASNDFIRNREDIRRQIRNIISKENTNTNEPIKTMSFAKYKTAVPVVKQSPQPKTSVSNVLAKKANSTNTIVSSFEKEPKMGLTYPKLIRDINTVFEEGGVNVSKLLSLLGNKFDDNKEHIFDNDSNDYIYKFTVINNDLLCLHGALKDKLELLKNIFRTPIDKYEPFPYGVKLPKAIGKFGFSSDINTGYIYKYITKKITDRANILLAVLFEIGYIRDTITTGDILAETGVILDHIEKHFGEDKRKMFLDELNKIIEVTIGSSTYKHNGKELYQLYTDSENEEKDNENKDGDKDNNFICVPSLSHWYYIGMTSKELGLITDRKFNISNKVVKLSKVSFETILTDLDEKCINYILTKDGEFLELMMIDTILYGAYF